MRVATMRCYHKLPAYSSNQPKPDSLTLEQAAEKLGICATTTRKLLDIGVIEGTQVIPCAPWQIFPAALETDAGETGDNSDPSRKASFQHNTPT